MAGRGSEWGWLGRDLADRCEQLRYLGKGMRLDELVVVLAAGEVALELPLEGVHSLALHSEELHYVHPVPLRLPALLLLLQPQLLLPRRLKLSAPLEVLQSRLLRVLEAREVGVRLRALVLQELLEGLHYFGLVLDRMVQEFLLIEEADASEVREEGAPGREAFEIGGWVESVEDEDLFDVAADQELHFDVLVVGAADEP